MRMSCFLILQRKILLNFYFILYCVLLGIKLNPIKQLKVNYLVCMRLRRRGLAGKVIVCQQMSRPFMEGMTKVGIGGELKIGAPSAWKLSVTKVPTVGRKTHLSAFIPS